MNVKSLVNVTGLKLRKAAPEILLGIGIAGIVGAGIHAVHIALNDPKAQQIKKELEKELQDAKEIREQDKNNTLPEGTSYSSKDYHIDIVRGVAKAGCGYIKVFAKPLIEGAAGISCIIFSHHIKMRRISALATVLAAKTDDFNKYRNRIKERFGDDVDAEALYGTIEKEVVDKAKTKGGKDKEIKKTVKDFNRSDINSPFCLMLGPGNTWYDEDHNKFVNKLEHLQAYSNDALKRNKIIEFNEIRTQLDFSKTAIGHDWGWFYDEKNPRCACNIDFGIHNPVNDGFFAGDTDFIVLNFNVDGFLMDLNAYYDDSRLLGIEKKEK